MQEPEDDLSRVESPQDRRKRIRARAKATFDNLQQRHVLPTIHRGVGGPDHQHPYGKHSRGREQNQGVWHGTSRVVNRAAKNRANKASWAKELRQARATR